MTTDNMTMTVEEAGRMLGVSRATAYKMVEAGKMPGVFRPAKRNLKVSRPAIEEFLRKPKGV